MTAQSKAQTLNVAAIGLLAVAVVGIPTAWQGGCENPPQVVDAQTGRLRPATTQEVVRFVQDAGDVGRAVTVATGQVAWLPFVDIAVRLAAVLAAFLMERPRRAAQAPG